MRRGRVWYASTVMALLGLTGCAGIAEQQYTGRVKNKLAPDFELTALDGAKVRLSDQRGKPVLVAFFAYG